MQVSNHIGSKTNRNGGQGDSSSLIARKICRDDGCLIKSKPTNLRAISI